MGFPPSHLLLTDSRRLMCHRYSQCGKSSIISRDDSDDDDDGLQSGPPLTKDFSRTSRIASFDTSNTLYEESSSISETLLKRASISFASSFSQALIAAIQTTKPSNIRAQLERGADILARDGDGCCAIHHAVRAGGRRALSELLNSEQLKGDPQGINQPDRSGATPLHYATSMGKMEFARILIEAGADKDAVDNHKRSPLYMAVQGNHESLVELLMDRGAKENPDLPPRFKEMQSSIKLRKRRQEKDAKKKKTR
jgi:ankyrin repeat protein